MKASEENIIQALAKKGGFFSWEHNFCVVPNVSHGFFPWEADLLICSKPGYLVEVEVKISASDWKNDQKKKKFTLPKDPVLNFTAESKTWPRIREFWYAAPMVLADRWEEFGIPEFAGVVGVNLEENTPWNRFNVLKAVTPNRKAPKLTDLEKAHLARLGTIRLWTKEKP